MVFGNSIIPYPVRSYLFFVTKKCRIYAACGVSQTPITTLQERGGSNMRKIGKVLAMCSLFLASAANSACMFWLYQDENEELKRLRKF